MTGRTTGRRRSRAAAGAAGAAHAARGPGRGRAPAAQWLQRPLEAIRARQARRLRHGSRLGRGREGEGQKFCCSKGGRDGGREGGKCQGHCQGSSGDSPVIPSPLSLLSPAGVHDVGITGGAVQVPGLICKPCLGLLPWTPRRLEVLGSNLNSNPVFGLSLRRARPH